MSNQPWTRTLRRAGALLTLGVTAVAAHPALAQTAQSPPPAPFMIGQQAQQAATPQTPQVPQSAGPNLQISIDQAVQMALEANLGLKAQRLDIDAAAQSLAAARANFLPRTSTTVSRNNTSAPEQQNEDGTFTNPTTTRLSTRASVQQFLPWYGTSYNVNWNGGRVDAPGSPASYNPSLSSSFSFNVTQPLWRGLILDQNRFSVRQQERLQQITDLQVRQFAIQTEATVKSAYLTLVAARETYKVSQQNLQLAQDALANSKARVQVGVAPETDILADEANVATRRVDVISAEATIAQAEDNLRRLILDPARPDYWQVSLVPTDAPQLTERQIDVDQAIQEALANRIDLTIARSNLELTDLGLRVAKDQTRPDLNFALDYAASGSGGRANNASLVDRGFGTVLKETFAGDYPSWTTSVTFSYPLGRSSQEATYARQQIQRQQQQIDLQDLQLQIVNQVRNAVRQVQNSARQVEAARAALDSSRQNLEAEQRKFAVGLSTPLNLQVFQSNLASAALRELQAIISYNRALIEFDRVLRIQ
jgi:outer membrane protein TolC